MKEQITPLQRQAAQEYLTKWATTSLLSNMCKQAAALVWCGTAVCDQHKLTNVCFFPFFSNLHLPFSYPPHSTLQPWSSRECPDHLKWFVQSTTRWSVCFCAQPVMMYSSSLSLSLSSSPLPNPNKRQRLQCIAAVPRIVWAEGACHMQWRGWCTPY